MILCVQVRLESERSSYNIPFCLFLARQPPWVTASSFTRLLGYIQRSNAVGRTSLDKWSARRRDLYMHNTQHSQQTFIHALGGIRTHNLCRWAVVNLRLRPRAHKDRKLSLFKTYKAELNPIYQLLALLEFHHIIHFSRIRVTENSDL